MSLSETFPFPSANHFSPLQGVGFKNDVIWRVTGSIFGSTWTLVTEDLPLVPALNPYSYVCIMGITMLLTRGVVERSNETEGSKSCSHNTGGVITVVFT
jgi:hypothetical protein